jgi:hypothetical protein
MLKMKRLVWLIAVVSLASGCGYVRRMTGHMAGQVAGSGVRKTEKREVAAFTSVSLSGAYEVEIASQQERSLELEGDDNLLPLITTEVKNNVLHVGGKQGFSTSKPIRVKITMPDIAELSSSGASSITLTDVKNEKLEIDTSGASNINASGETKTLAIDMSGASNVNTQGLRAANVSIDSSGASNAKVFVTEELTANLSGVGNVSYKGDPKIVNKEISGFGSVTKE